MGYGVWTRGRKVPELLFFKNSLLKVSFKKISVPVKFLLKEMLPLGTSLESVLMEQIF